MGVLGPDPGKDPLPSYYGGAWDHFDMGNSGNCQPAHCIALGTPKQAGKQVREGRLSHCMRESFPSGRKTWEKGHYKKSKKNLSRETGSKSPNGNLFFSPCFP